MKYLITSILFFVSFQIFSQSKSVSSLITLISKADTVYFVADNSGCFHAYVLEVKLCKQKSGERKLIMKTDTGLVEKKLSAKKYQAFINNYKASTNYFIKNNKQTCTSTTEFDLYCKTKSGSANGSKFKNVNCDAKYNPELFLQELLRIKEGAKK
ncbi:MAG: hypothetical protein KA163_08040 [Bacteroidia bacterium]|nr:hypothetical protein [Bacteroidia bacterium]